VNRIPPKAQHPSKRLFEYSGDRALTVFGRVTGIRYHFPGPGARVWVDGRDASILQIIRGLEIVVGSQG
jgi:hypothetical protein